MLRRRSNLQKGRGKKSSEGQVFLEYTMILGVIVLIVFAMNPMIKRGIQGMIKVVADQVGIQGNSDQRFDESGHLERSSILTHAYINGTRDEYVGIDGRSIINYISDDVISTNTTMRSNLGFTEEN